MTANGKVMIITGASSGIGRDAALLAAARGYRVVVAARRAERLDALVAEIAQRGGTALAVPCDVTVDAEQEKLVQAALAQFGQIDVLVNNAGVPLHTDFADATPEELRRQWETNVTALVLLSRRALPALLRSKGVIINIGSTAGHFSIPGWGNYFPTKVAVRSFSHALRREVSARGVRVALVEPGPFATEFGTRAGMPGNNGLPPAMVARTIIRLAACPRAVAIVPWALGPFVIVGGAVAALLPGVVDLLFWVVGRLKLHQQ